MNGVSDKPQLIAISTSTLVKTALFILSLALLWYLRELIALFFVSLILASLINPIADWFESKGVGRAAAVLLLYLGIIGVIALFFFLLVPAVIVEMRDLIKNADAIWAAFLDMLGPLRPHVATRGLGDFLNQLIATSSEGVSAAAGGLVATIRGFFGGLVSLIIVFVVTFYLVVSEDSLRWLFRTVAPEPYQPFFRELFKRIERGVGAWMRGMLILGLIVAVAVYVSLKILGVKYALVLALAAGVAELLPYVGPVLSAIPAALIALTMSPLKALLVVAVYVVIQQVENHVLVPKVMQKATGLHPIISIFALLIGVRMAGLVGALLAIPTAVALRILIDDAYRLIKSQKR